MSRLKQCGMFDEDSFNKLSIEDLNELYDYYPIRQIVAAINYKVLNRGIKEKLNFIPKPYNHNLNPFENYLEQSSKHNLKRRVFGPGSWFYYMYGPETWNKYFKTLKTKFNKFNYE
jgi:hypothetical protein